jgi:Holliday junction resolvase RusA-like endonuclease
MAVHLEFVVPGPPISNQQSTPKGKANLLAWRSTVRTEAQLRWMTNPMLTGHLKTTIINFFSGSDPSVDVDNMSKPILDAMHQLIYDDDRQIRQAQITHVEVGAAFSLVGVSKVIVNALQAGNEFVYVRIEDPVNPYPLPQ